MTNRVNEHKNAHELFIRISNRVLRSTILTSFIWFLRPKNVVTRLFHIGFTFNILMYIIKKEDIAGYYLFIFSPNVHLFVETYKKKKKKLKRCETRVVVFFFLRINFFRIEFLREGGAGQCREMVLRKSDRFFAVASVVCARLRWAVFKSKPVTKKKKKKKNPIAMETVIRYG